LNDLDWLVASLGTDGIDGNTEAAGAWISPQNLQRVRELRLDIQSYLDNNDSHRFFSRAGGLIITGPTGTNVMDLRVMCIS
jgi:glycerate 2-kinase